MKIASFNPDKWPPFLKAHLRFEIIVGECGVVMVGQPAQLPLHLLEPALGGVDQLNECVQFGLREEVALGLAECLGLLFSIVQHSGQFVDELGTFL
jgi:hypothetical protein